MFAETTYFPAGRLASGSTVVGGPVGMANSFARSTLKASLNPGGPCAPIGPGGPVGLGAPGGPCAPGGPVWFHQTDDQFCGQPSSFETSCTAPLESLTQA